MVLLPRFIAKQLQQIRSKKKQLFFIDKTMGNCSAYPQSQRRVSTAERSGAIYDNSIHYR